MKHILLSIFLISNARDYQKADLLIDNSEVRAVERGQSEDLVIKYLSIFLKSSGKSARIYYEADCKTDEDPLNAFPIVSVQPPPSNEFDISAVEKMFRNDVRVKVSERGGIIIVDIGQVPKQVLKTIIGQVKFDGFSKYNAYPAIFAIENTSEVINTEDVTGIRQYYEYYNILMANPNIELPHMPDNLEKVSMDQALDVVSKTLHQIVVYGFCVSSKKFNINLR